MNRFTATAMALLFALVSGSAMAQAPAAPSGPGADKKSDARPAVKGERAAKAKAKSKSKAKGKAKAKSTAKSR